MSSKSCAGCAKPLPKYEYLQCSACRAAYDLECLNMNIKRFNSFYSANSDKKKSWKCPECISRQPKSGNINTPVRAAPASDEEADACSIDKNVTQRGRRRPLASSPIECDSVASEIKLYLEEMRALRTEMSLFRETMSELSATVKAQNLRMDSLESRIDALEVKMSEPKNNEVLALEETISQLKSQMQERDQDFLINDVEISDYPEAAGENTTHIVLTIATKLGVDLEERDIVSTERAGPVRAPREGGAPPRPRPLVVRLARRAPRDAMLRAARVRRGLNTEGMSVPGPPRPFYINERLTRLNRQLFQKTRESSKRRNWKYVWTREGRIFTRREQGTPSYRIRSELDIARVFGTDTVSASYLANHFKD